jgi:hypothetical protein
VLSDRLIMCCLVLNSVMLSVNHSFRCGFDIRFRVSFVFRACLKLTCFRYSDHSL